jgi:hypothetical protein
MRTSSRAGIALIALAFVATCSLTLASATSLNVNTRDTSASVVGKEHPNAAVLLAPTCKSVPTSVFTRDLGASMIFTGTSYPNGRVIFFGKTILVDGKPISVVWLSCGYSHNPANPASLGVAASYLATSSAAKALAILRAMCGAMRSVSPDYTAPKLGSGSCVQGHTGPMQSANGLVAIDNVVIQLFGSQSPAQTLVLDRDVTKLVAKARTTTTTTLPSLGPQRNGPMISTTTTQFSVANGFMALTLKCVRAKCAGVVKLTAATPTGTVILAQTQYLMPMSTTKPIDLTMNAAGSNFFASATTSPAQVTLTMTVAGGATVTNQINVSVVAPPTSVATTTTIVVTTTTP